ncbi:hypothetical protein [Chitiniphilus shinanonensis]|nr:hypothetical protein [Chitiniphilus shinanonensis]
MRRVIVVLAALALTACAAFRPKVENGQFAVLPGQGAALIAVTMTTFDPDTAQAGVVINGVGGNTSVLAQQLTDYIRAPGDEPDGKGRLFLISLPPGDYRITEAYGSWMQEIGGWRYREYVNVPRNDPFHVDAGRVVYLGQMNVNLNYRPDAQTSDTRVRDLNHAQVLWGVTDTSNIDFRPLSGPGKP